MGNADIKLLKSQAKFQSDQDYFRCPAVAHGTPIKTYDDMQSDILQLSFEIV